MKQAALLHERAEATGAGWDQVFGPLSPIFRRNDIAIVNLEAPVVDGQPAASGNRVFSAPKELLGGLSRAGVTIASFANNHALDQRRDGITSTRALVHEAGLGGVGADVNQALAWRPVVVEKHGLKVGVLSVTRWLNARQNAADPNQPHVPIIAYPGDVLVGSRSLAQARALVKAEAAKVDALIVFIHWGLEYQAQPLEADRTLAAALLEAGALAVVGHHPHVLQPVEWLERADGTRGLVAFSLGNLVSNQDASDASGLARDGLLLEVVVEKGPGGAQIASVSGVPIGIENRAQGGRLRNVQPVLLQDELAAMTERLEVLASRRDGASKAEQRALIRRLAVARARMARIQAVLGPTALVSSAPASSVVGVADLGPRP